MTTEKVIEEVERLAEVEDLCKEILITLTLPQNQPNIPVGLQETIERWRKEGKKLKLIGE